MRRPAPPLYHLTGSAIGTSLCSSLTHHTRSTNVRGQRERHGHRLTPRITDGFDGWTKLILRDGWKCGWGSVRSLFSPDSILRLYFGRVRRRGKFPRGEGVPIHRSIVLHVARCVSSFLLFDTSPLTSPGQLGNSIMHVLLLGVYAEEVRVEPARCTGFSLLLPSFSFPLTITRFSLTLGYPDLCWRPWNACGI